MSIKKDILWRVYLAFFLIGILGVAIVGKAAKTQLAEGEYWKSMADSLTIFPKVIEADRGNIYSEDGRLLATSLSYFEVRMDFRSEPMTDEIFNEHVDSLAIYMAKHLGKKTKAQYKQELISNRQIGNRYYLVARDLTYVELKEMKQWPLFREGRYKSGMIVIEKQKREMPFGMLAQRTIGYVRDEGHYRVGLEGKYDDLLTGVQGQVLVQKVAGGTLIPLNGEEVSAQPGFDIYTTLNINIQDVAENALLKALKTHAADHGSVILMEVKTGKIKAIANIGLSEEGFYWEDYNYAIGEATEPGSTFKLATMISLLEDGYVSLQDSINLENGKKKFYNHWMRDSHPPKDNVVTVEKAFQESSNVAMSKLASQHYGSQPDKFYQHLVDLRLNQPCGIELVGEPNPVIHHPDDWSGVSLPWMSVGYEVQLTPLQTLTFYNAIANDGKMMKPYLVSDIKEYHKTVESFDPVVLKESMCSETTLKQVQNMLTGVVENGGTGQSLKNPNYTVAGKTGTAQIADKNSGYSKKVYQSSFVGYFPADNPQYSCIVVINAPSKGGYYGATVAGPVFKEIADKVYASDLEMHQPMNQETLVMAPGTKNGMQADLAAIYSFFEVPYTEVASSEWVFAQADSNAVSMKANGVAVGKVPNVKGMTLKDALYLLEACGLKVQIEGVGKVKQQSITPGTAIQGNQEIRIVLG